ACCRRGRRACISSRSRKIQTKPPSGTRGGGSSRKRSVLAPNSTICTRASGAQLARRLEREVGQHPVGARALEREQAFHHHEVVVQPTVGGRALEHRVFARDLVGEGGDLEL